MRKVESSQIQQIHAILAKMGRIKDKEFKADLVKMYTNDRETSTTGLSYDEAEKMIGDLNAANRPQQQVTTVQIASVTRNDKPKDKVRQNRLNGVFSMMHKLKWYTDETIDSDKPKLDYKYLDNWLMKYGHHHKILDAHKTDELSVVIFQLGQVLKAV